jgi:hypothetical protein
MEYCFTCNTSSKKLKFAIVAKKLYCVQQASPAFVFIFLLTCRSLIKYHERIFLLYKKAVMLETVTMGHNLKV